MKKPIAVLLVLVLAGGASAGVYYHWFYKGAGSSTSGERVSSDSENAVYVDSVSVLAGLGSGNGLIQRYAGVIEPQQTWEVKLENDRTVKECYVKEGDEVKEGQKLFIYDTTDDEDKLAQAQIDLERCQNEIDTSTARKAQLEKEKKSASADDQLTYTTQILTEENTIKKSQYEYKSKELEIEQLKTTIANAVISSELAGVVKSINDPGSNSSNSDSSDSAYITVLEVGDYRVKGTVNEQNKDQIYDGMEMIVHSRVDESVTWHGTISEINLDKGESNTNSNSGFYSGSSSDNGTSSTNYPFYVTLDSSDGLLLGQHVYME
ncbi:MAG: efflux RND transporter periplasmic adaptor subunit, partial [Lachnospiraceae bacterium]|nr:efflux RND transporter periplasmic adaptor subunit [Lachnospiraceae bacterium]